MASLRWKSFDDNIIINSAYFNAAKALSALLWVFTPNFIIEVLSRGV